MLAPPSRTRTHVGAGRARAYVRSYHLHENLHHRAAAHLKHKQTAFSLALHLKPATGLCNPMLRCACRSAIGEGIVHLFEGHQRLPWCGAAHQQVTKCSLFSDHLVHHFI
jgi:hypothetical protein